MKTTSFLFSASLILSGAELGRSAITFSDDFNTANGDLVGYNSWAETSSGTAIQINNQAVALANMGQDAYRSFSSSIPGTAGTSFYVGLNVVVSAAASGDYFLHTVVTGGNISGQSARLYVQSSGSGFVLGIAPQTTGLSYGTTVLSLNTDYRVVLRYNFVSGSGNDSMALYVDPASSVEGNNSTYATATAAGGTDPSAAGAINFRQGTAGMAPTVTADNLTIATTFAEAIVPVPELEHYALSCALGLIGIAAGKEIRRRRLS